MNYSINSIWRKKTMQFAGLLILALWTNTALRAADDSNSSHPTVSMKTELSVGSKVKIKIVATGEVKLSGVKNATDFVNGKPITYTLSDKLITIEGLVTELDCSNAKLTQLDVSQASELKKLYCYSNKLEGIDVRSNEHLTHLNCSGNALNALDLSQNKHLQGLYCYDNKLSDLNLRVNTELAILYCHNNALKSLPLGDNKALTELYCRDNKLTQLDVSNNEKLRVLSCGQNQISVLDLKKNRELEGLGCSNNLLSEINVDENKKLKWFYCYGNKLSQVLLSAHNLLEELDCGKNPIESIDLKQLQALKELTVDGCKLTELDLSANRGLEKLICSDNNLSGLDLTHNAKLTHLTCNNNKLTTLNLEGMPKLVEVRLWGNRIEGASMTTIMQALPQPEQGVLALIYVIDSKGSSEGNKCLDTDVKIAKAKNWLVCDFNGSENDAVEYDGLQSSAVEVVADGTAFSFSRGNGTIELSGALAHSVVMFYSVEGICLGETKADAMGHASFSIPDEVGGIYIVRSGDRAFKLQI